MISPLIAVPGGLCFLIRSTDRFIDGAPISHYRSMLPSLLRILIKQQPDDINIIRTKSIIRPTLCCPAYDQTVCQSIKYCKKIPVNTDDTSSMDIIDAV